MYYIGSSIIKNGVVESLCEQEPIGADNELYELIRIENKKPVFIDDHLERLAGTLKRTGRKIECFDKIKSLIDWLILCNSIDNCDIRISLSPSGTFQAGFVPSSYPTAQMYADGIDACLLKASRETPEAKIYHADMRSEAEKQQQRENVYESILVDANGMLTEGSRSNIFFIKNETIYTAPDKMVLGGIIRKKLIEICGEQGIKITFSAVEDRSISDYESAFITSTPAKILPIRRIDRQSYDVKNETLRKLMTEMDKAIKQR